MTALVDEHALDGGPFAARKPGGQGNPAEAPAGEIIYVQASVEGHSPEFVIPAGGECRDGNVLQTRGEVAVAVETLLVIIMDMAALVYGAEPEVVPGVGIYGAHIEVRRREREVGLRLINQLARRTVIIIEAVVKGVEQQVPVAVAVDQSHGRRGQAAAFAEGLGERHEPVAGAFIDMQAGAAAHPDFTCLAHIIYGGETLLPHGVLNFEGCGINFADIFRVDEIEAAVERRDQQPVHLVPALLQHEKNLFELIVLLIVLENRQPGVEQYPAVESLRQLHVGRKVDVIKAHASEVIAFGIIYGYTVGGRGPEPASRVAEDVNRLIARKAVVVVDGIILAVFAAVEAVEPPVGADPDVSARILGDALDVPVGNALGQDRRFDGRGERKQRSQKRESEELQHVFSLFYKIAIFPSRST